MENFNRDSKKVALVGRPNVGKSTLFNRLSLGKKAITHDLAGVTRDRKYSPARVGGIEFTIIDTPGLEDTGGGSLEGRASGQTEKAISEADLVCAIVDGRSGILPIDYVFADLIRKGSKNTCLLVNKCEKRFDFGVEYYNLGLGEPIAISAEHGTGLSGFYEILKEKLGSGEDSALYNDPFSSEIPLIVIAGRPNVGKSTFINALLGSERLLTGPEAGITRESIEIDYEHKNSKLKLIDTAGLRKKSSVKESLEKLSVSDSLNAIKFANLVILVVDATGSLDKQDLAIAGRVIEEGRSLVMAVNKIDAAKDRAEREKFFSEEIERRLPQIKGLPIVFISAKEKKGLNILLDQALKTYGLWNKRIPTSKLNDWLRFTLEAHRPPSGAAGKSVKIKYITQIKSRPPTFKIFCNYPEYIDDSYQRYLAGRLREDFKLPGVPIRFSFTKSKNPYAGKK